VSSSCALIHSLSLGAHKRAYPDEVPLDVYPELYVLMFGSLAR
jgi:hypothetical protein